MREPPTRNHYGQPIIPPDQFDGKHYPAIVPTSAGSPPVCSCGWTRYYNGQTWVELYEHILVSMERN